MWLKLIPTFFLVIGLYVSSIAQFGRTQEGASDIYTNPSINRDSLPMTIVRTGNDSMIYKYAYASDLTSWEYYADTLLDLFHQYDPARNGPVDYYTLGHTGTAAHPMRYEIRESIGYDNGLHQYDLYAKTKENFRYFDTNRPLNHLSFSPLDGQQNFMVEALFSREFSDGISFNLDYSRIKQNGFYLSQENKHTNLATGIKYSSESNRYQLLLNYFVNNFNERMNGGLSNIEDFNDPTFIERTTLPTNLRDAELRYGNSEFNFQQFIQLLPKGSFNLKLTSDHSLVNRYYRYSDQISSEEEEAYYEGVLNDDRGLRAVLNEQKYTNSAKLHLESPFLRLYFGIEHDYIKYDQELETKAINNVILEAGLSSNIKKIIQFNTDLKLGTLDATGDFSIDTRASLNYKDWLDLSGKLYIYRYTPSLDLRSMVVSQSSIYNQDLRKPFGSQLSVTARIPKTSTSLTIRQGIEDNSIFREREQIAPQQFTGQLTTFQAELQQSIKWWILGHNTSVLYQTFNEDLYHLPSLVSKQSLYTNLYLFDRKMHLQAGADYRFIPFDKAVDFFPINGQLYAVDSNMPDLEAVDFFINFKIKQFRFFIKAENALDLFTETKNYTVLNYPDYDWALRLGVSWLLAD